MAISLGYRRFVNASQNFDLKELVALHKEALADQKLRKNAATSIAITRIVTDSLIEVLHSKADHTQFQSIGKNIQHTVIQVLTQLKSPHAGSTELDMLHKKVEIENSVRATFRENSVLLLQHSLEGIIENFLMQDLKQKVAAVEESIGRIIEENSVVREFLDADIRQDTHQIQYQNEHLQEECSSPNYMRIWMDRLTEGEIQLGKELYGTLCVDGLLLGNRVFTVLDDGENRGVLLSIYITRPPDSASRSHFLEKFPCGLRLAIRDPKLVSTEKGCNCIWVENFEDSLIPVPSIPQAPAAIDLLTKGIKCSELEDIDTAIYLFTRALNSVRNISENDSETMKSLSELHFHRAKAYFKKGRYANALADVLFLRRIGDARYQIVMALLLEVTESYEEAYLVWRLVSDKDGDLDKYCCPSRMERCRDLYILKFRQQFERFLSTQRMKMEHCSSGFVGPIEIKVLDESCLDRGLFITQDCMAGDLVLVCNPVVDTMEEGEALDHISLGMHRFDALSNIEVQELHHKLLIEAKRSPILQKRIWALFYHSRLAPDIHLYWPEQYQERKSEQGATELQEECPNWDLQLADSVRLYATGVQYPNKNEPSEARIFCGVYLLPGFINHSCIPSASRFYIGKSMFVIAARDMKAGDEITFPYISAIHPFSERKQMLKEWGIHDCYCRRCKFENSISTMVPKIPWSVLIALGDSEILKPMERDWLIASHQHELLSVSHPNEYESIGQEHGSIFDVPSYYVDNCTRLEVLQAIQATVPGHPYFIQMLVKEAELIFVTNESLESLELIERILNMARNAFYSVYGNQLEAGLVDEVLSEISKSNRQYSKECMDRHAHQAASPSGLNPDHQQPRFPFLSDMGKEFTDGDDGPGSNFANIAQILRFLLPPVQPPCDNEEHENFLKEF